MAKYNYIFTPFQAALDAGLITENTTRRVNLDRSVVILSDQDLATFTPLIQETITPEEGTPYEVERYAETLSDKAEYLSATVMSQEQAIIECQKPEWN